MGKGFCPYSPEGNDDGGSFFSSYFSSKFG